MENGVNTVLHVEVAFALGAVAEDAEPVGVGGGLLVEVEDVAVGVALAEDGDKAEEVSLVELAALGVGGNEALAGDLGSAVEGGLYGKQIGLGGGALGGNEGFAVNGASGGEGKAADAVGAGGFEDVGGRDGVLLEIAGGVFPTVADIGIGGEVEDHVGPGHGGGEGGEVEVIAFDKFKEGRGEGTGEEAALAGGEVVPTGDAHAVGQEAVDEIGTNEAGGTGDESVGEGHRRQRVGEVLPDAPRAEYVGGSGLARGGRRLDRRLGAPVACDGMEVKEPTTGEGGGSGGRGRIGPGRWLARVGAMVAVGWFYFFFALQPSGGLWQETPAGVYGLVTEAWTAGQLHLLREPEPELLALPDPYDPAANGPYRLHDASLYDGKYYIYFGASPVAVLLGPWHWLTGTYLTEAAASAVFAYVGFLAALVLLARARRWLGGADGVGWDLVGVALAGLGTMVPTVLHGPNFYVVPIVAAYAFLMTSIVFLALAWDARRPLGWLVGASVMYGLAIAARPNYVLGGVVIFLPVLWHVGRAGGWRRRVGAAVAAYGPLGLIGVAMLVHNYVRFDSFKEFGIKYQLAGQSMLDAVTLQTRLWPEGIALYGWEGARLDRYFPFFLGGETGIVGLVWGAPILWVLPWGLWCLARRRDVGGRAAGGLALMLAGFGLVTVGLLAAYFFRVDRYVVDFYPAWGLLAGVAALAWLGGRSGRAGWLGMVVGLLVWLTVALNLAVSGARFVVPEKLRGLARVLNAPVELVESLAGVEHGAWELEIEVPAEPRWSVREPLLTTGVWRTRSDVVFIEYGEEGRARLGYFHVGWGAVRSAELAVTPGATYRLKIMHPGLTPPPSHGMFAGWAERTRRGAQRRVWMEWEGETVVEAAMGGHQARRGDVWWGETPWPVGTIEPKFEGEWRVVGREPLREEELVEPAVPRASRVVLEVTWPVDARGSFQPVLATGRTGEHDLLYALFGATGRMRLAFNHHRYGGPVSEEFAYEGARPSRLAVQWATLGEGVSAGEGRLLVLVDDVVVLDATQVFYAVGASEVDFGANPHGAGTAGAHFLGRLVGARAGTVRDFPVAVEEALGGRVVAGLRFPTDLLGRAEPLVVTGRTGAGDFLYVRYVAEDRVQFGYDHWGVGGGAGPEVAVVPGARHVVEIEMDGLYPGESRPGAERGRVRVKLDGAVVLALDGVGHHPAAVEEIKLGKNEIGGSTCEAEFTGTFEFVVRPE